MEVASSAVIIGTILTAYNKHLIPVLLIFTYTECKCDLKISPYGTPDIIVTMSTPC